MLSCSLTSRAIVLSVACLGLVLCYEATSTDSAAVARQALVREASIEPSSGVALRFSATAYCRGVTTASGTPVRSGIAAADPAVLPAGSVVRLDSLGPYNGIYTVMDTGPQVRGREVDLYIWNCDEAVRFGRRAARLSVLRFGWDPRVVRNVEQLLE
jgi:3D (Asp-Asp-Asp) domain-containing protein